MPRLYYLSHPEVVIDPDRPVPDWPLNETGQARVQGWVESGFFRGVTRVWSSTERKAVMTATPIAASLGLPCHTGEDLGENDRSATGFLPPPAFEAAANRFFASPDESFRGWETARAAQNRIVRAVGAIAAEPAPGDTLVVGHGAVGTLLFCHAAGLPIDRRHDQPQGGCLLIFAPDLRHADGPWRRMEDVLADV